MHRPGITGLGGVCPVLFSGPSAGLALAFRGSDSYSHLLSCVPWLHGVMLHRFLATTDALTCAGRGFQPMRGPDLDCPRQGSLLHARDLPTIPSPPTSRVQPGFSFVHHSALAVISGCG